MRKNRLFLRGAIGPDSAHWTRTTLRRALEPWAAFAVALSLASTAFAVTYYVATDGDDGDSGSIDSPWATIQRAADTMVAGDRVFVRGGTYFETVEPQNSGTLGNEIVYSGFPEETAIIDPNDASFNGVAILLPDARTLRHLRFENLTLQNAGGFGFYARVRPGVLPLTRKRRKMDVQPTAGCKLENSGWG